MTSCLGLSQECRPGNYLFPRERFGSSHITRAIRFETLGEYLSIREIVITLLVRRLEMTTIASVLLQDERLALRSIELPLDVLLVLCGGHDLKHEVIIL